MNAPRSEFKDGPHEQLPDTERMAIVSQELQQADAFLLYLMQHMQILYKPLDGGRMIGINPQDQQQTMDSTHANAAGRKWDIQTPRYRGEVRRTVGRTPDGQPQNNYDFYTADPNQKGVLTESNLDEIEEMSLVINYLAIQLVNERRS